jgi:putative sterol carrier protein
MQEVLTRTFELMKKDEVFTEGTKKAKLTISFEIDDLGLTYTMWVDYGTVMTKFGVSPGQADLQLAMSSDGYDRLFTGKLNPMKGMLFGDIAAVGNIAAGRKLQGLLPDMIRAYKKAKLVS